MPIIISMCSLIVAIISLLKSSKAQELQNQVNKMELHIKEHNIEAINQEFAAKVSSWIGAEISDETGRDDAIPVAIANYSDLPIYDVVVSIDVVNDAESYSAYDNNYTAYTYFVPPGSYYIYAPWPPFGMCKNFNSSITFRDAKGNWWCRDAFGNIEQSFNSLDKYGIMRPATSEQIYKL